MAKAIEGSGTDDEAKSANIAASASLIGLLSPL